MGEAVVLKQCVAQCPISVQCAQNLRCNVQNVYLSQIFAPVLIYMLI